MENVKKLNEIREFLKKQNDHWWNEERKDLDLKYYVPTDIICQALEDYEVGISKEIADIIEEKNKDHYFTFYDEYNYYEDLVEQGKAKYLGGDNTYNHCGKVQNDFQWHTFKMLDEEDKYIVLLAFHIGGDIRGNYTDYIVLEFDYEVGFEEYMMSEISYEYGLTFDLEVNGKVYEITPFVFDECLEVYDREKDDYIYGIFETDDEEVIEQIKEKLNEIEEEEEKI